VERRPPRDGPPDRLGEPVGPPTIFPGLRDVVAHALTDSALDPKLLCLEITETVLMEDAGSSRTALDSLKALGVQLAVDDSGPGIRRSSTSGGFPSTS